MFINYFADARQTFVGAVPSDLGVRRVGWVMPSPVPVDAPLSAGMAVGLILLTLIGPIGVLVGAVVTAAAAAVSDPDGWAHSRRGETTLRQILLMALSVAVVLALSAALLRVN
jgi:hypothetical protein